MLETFGIACAGPFVYPKELRLLARSILPFGMKTVGRFFNVIGPFLGRDPGHDADHRRLRPLGAADVPPARRRGSQQALLDLLQRARRRRAARASRRAWSTTASSDEEFTLDPRELGLGAGSFDELLPVADLDDTVSHFLALIGGDGPAAALESIRLNAAALALNGEVVEDLAGGARARRRSDEQRRAGEADRAACARPATSGAPAGGERRGSSPSRHRVGPGWRSS